MNRFIGFDEWQELVAESMSEDQLSGDCPSCDGEGTEEAGTTCKVCGGDGRYHYPVSGPLAHPALSRRAYERAITEDLKKACAFSRWDFLDMASIFAKECRRVPS